MTQSADSFKKKALDRWKPILESMGVTGSKNDWMSQYVSKHQANEDFLNQTQRKKFPSILPMMDLVSVTPISEPVGNSKEEIDRIKAEVKAENRDNKIESIIKGIDYVEKKIEEHPDYKGPKINLFYFDYVYGGSTSSGNKDDDNSSLGK